MNPQEELVRLRRQVEALNRQIYRGTAVSFTEPTESFTGQMWINPQTETAKLRIGNSWKTITLT